MDQDAFVGKCIKFLTANGITVRFDNTKYIKTNGEAFLGIFYSDKKLLRVCTGCPYSEWFPVFVHEYAHFLQTLDGFSSLYPEDYWGNYYDWLSGAKELDQRLLRKYVKGIQHTEYDAEKRVIHMTKQYDLPIDIPTYTKGANAYILSYTVSRKHRTGYNDQFPSQVQEIVDIMPNKLLKSWTKLPPGYENLVLEHCF